MNTYEIISRGICPECKGQLDDSGYCSECHLIPALDPDYQRYITTKPVKKYLVICEETCPVCNGTGNTQHWQWREFWQEHPTGKADGNELNKWFLQRNGTDKWGMTNIPDEEEICYECEGKRTVRREIDLKTALQEINEADNAGSRGEVWTVPPHS